MTDILPMPSSELIDDLFNLVRRFGRTVPEGPYLFVAATWPRPVFVMASAVLNAQKMQVLGNHEGIALDDELIFASSKQGVHVRWNIDLSIEDVATFIENVDAKLRSFDGFDSSGRRRRVPYELSERLFHRSVMATFVERTMLVPIGSESAVEVVRRQFDYPELLVPFQNHFDQWHLCLKASLDENLRRDVAKRRACERLGVHSLLAFANLTPRQWQSFADAFTEELAKKPN
jgi:hypothetical protein